jgi:putative alpha-1,2-mannosidase
MLDVLVVPTRGDLKLVPGPLSDPDAGYRQRYSEEQAQPGYYRVKLESGVLAELTVTERTGWHRYTYPKGPGHVLVDLSHLVLDKSDEKPLITDAEITVEPDGTITGTRRVFRWAKGRRIFFAMQLSKKPSRIQLYGDGDAPASGTAVKGNRLKAALFFDELGDAPRLRTGISTVCARWRKGAGSICWAAFGSRAAPRTSAPSWPPPITTR